jgi:acyl-CoA synthetase (AMP-forming)/AMP-acid ligase II
METIREYIDHHSRERGENTFLIAPDSGQHASYSRLKRNVESIGAKLDDLGIEEGAKVAFLLDNGFWTTQIFLGVMASNRVIVPLNAVAGISQLKHVLGHCDAELAFVSRDYCETMGELTESAERNIQVITVDDMEGPEWPADGGENRVSADAPSPDSPALLLYTSGSTGLPKGAVLSHRAVTNGGRNVTGGHGLTETDRALCVLPVYHINGAMVTVSAPLASGGSVVMPTRFSARSFWSLVVQYRCTWSSIVPTIIKYLLDRATREDFEFGSDPRLSAFRFARSASAPLPATVLQEWERTFHVPMIETLGLTETAGTVSTNPMPPAERKPGSVGLPCGNEIIIMNAEGAECEPATVGEIVIRGDNVLDYYYKNPEATEAGFKDGWFRTGDQGRKDSDGYLFITGRSKELIIRGGENISPREIDDVLYKHDSILEAAAFGVDDDDYGQEVVACVVIRDGFNCTERELQEFCESSIGKYKTPKVIYFMEDLPKGPSGKILRLKLPGLVAALYGRSF